jgi:hypothetical protein
MLARTGLLTAERYLIHRWHTWCEPVLFALKKRRRLATFGIAQSGTLACCEIDLATDSPDCLPECREIVGAYERYLAKYAFRKSMKRDAVSPWQGIPLVIALDRYRDFTGYVDALKRHSKGSIRREIRKARREGFYCCRFDRHAYPADRFAIETSKWHRSSGPVLAAFVRPRPRSIATPVRPVEPSRPECPNHWKIDWGVFIDDPEAARARLVGYVYLRRTGNTVRLHAMMGHGAYLGRSIMKLLLADVVEWLLERDDPAVRGVRYLHGGALEHGSLGAVSWKHRAQFAPSIFAWAGATEPLEPTRERRGEPAEATTA